MNFKEILRITINLVVIYAVGGTLLAWVYATTSPVIYKKNLEEKAIKLNRMLPVHLAMNTTSATLDKVKAVLPEGAAPVIDGNALDVEIDGSLAEVLLKKVRKAGASEIREYSLNSPTKAGDWEPWHKHAEYYEVREGDEVKGYIVETKGKGYSSYIGIFAAIGTDLKIQKMSVLSHGETPGLGDEILADWFKNQYIGKDLAHLEVIKGPTDDKIQAITGATISSRAVTTGVRDAIHLLKEKYHGETAHYSWEGH